MNDQPIKHIVIVGGGSAGWITAGTLAAEHLARTEKGIRISLIESPDVATIGVGEGTWPSMRNTLKMMGISEKEFIKQCNVSYKQGSKFVGWRNGQADDFYYHPFITPPGYTEIDLHACWQQLSKDVPFADSVSVQSAVCQAGCAPKQFATPEYAGVTNYGYHLDAGKFAELLQKHCTEKLGVNHILDHVTEIISASNGDIAAIATKQSGNIEGDMFVDCTGVKSLLLGEHFAIPFIDKKHVLFNDTALALQVPYPEATSPITSATVSTAQSAGWIWDIGLPSRRGVGYVYSSAHTSEENATDELMSYVAKISSHETADSLSPRKINFRPGHREKLWHKNCVAIGMSAGFLEPLEASALALVELSCSMLSEELPVSRQHMEIVSNRFNQRFQYRWDRVIEFLKLHYVLSERLDSDYWVENKLPASIPPRLADLLKLWHFQPPSRLDFIQNEEVFPSASYQYVLYGMGFTTHPRATEKRSADLAIARQLFSENQNKIQQFVAGLPSNRELIHYLTQSS